ncbi:hypothetical protein AYI70_g10576 [Smittium culicis]|uniref:Uncharacterized protein n=1 Tax=Smittium culicis TaxID=133412 RepID=A0A1R1X5X4_9FUNG|nr:hypothetical protein AYI70_g10576 [Smittium culicis]
MSIGLDKGTTKFAPKIKRRPKPQDQANPLKSNASNQLPSLPFEDPLKNDLNLKHLISADEAENPKIMDLITETIEPKLNTLPDAHILQHHASHYTANTQLPDSINNKTKPISPIKLSKTSRVDSSMSKIESPVSLDPKSFSSFESIPNQQTATLVSDSISPANPSAQILSHISNKIEISKNFPTASVKQTTSIGIPKAISAPIQNSHNTIISSPSLFNSSVPSPIISKTSLHNTKKTTSIPVSTSNSTSTSIQLPTKRQIPPKKPVSKNKKSEEFSRNLKILDDRIQVLITQLPELNLEKYSEFIPIDMPKFRIASKTRARKSIKSSSSEPAALKAGRKKYNKPPTFISLTDYELEDPEVLLQRPMSYFCSDTKMGKPSKYFVERHNNNVKKKLSIISNNNEQADNDQVVKTIEETVPTVEKPTAEDNLATTANQSTMK